MRKRDMSVDELVALLRARYDVPPDAIALIVNSIHAARRAGIAEAAASIEEPLRRDEWSVHDVPFRSAVSPFFSEEEAMEAGAAIFGKNGKDFKAHNNGPRKLWCCEEHALEIRDTIRALTLIPNNEVLLKLEVEAPTPTERTRS